MATTLITGANRGIGLALTREFLDQGWEVLACCRHPKKASALLSLDSSRLTLHSLDVDDDSSIATLRQQLGDRSIDLLVNNAGIAGDRDHESFGDMNYESWAEIFRVNTMAPMKLTEALLANLEGSQQKHVANISSGLASITSQQGYMLPYSVSKSALNSVMKNLSAVLNGRLRINLFSPGWVQSDMGGEEAPLSTAQSAAALYQNITSLGAEDTGRFLDINGQDTPW